MLANQIVLPLEDPRAAGRAIRTVNSPIEVEGVPKRPPTAAPELGQDTREVLGALGYSRRKRSDTSWPPASPNNSRLARGTSGLAGRGESWCSQGGGRIIGRDSSSRRD